MRKPVLALPNYDEPFEVHIDASDNVVSGVQVHNRHLVAFKSWKLKDEKQQYSAHELEMLAVVHCVQVWNVYLLGASFLSKLIM